MQNKAIKISLIITNIFILLLIIASVSLPWMVTWYVEKMGRSQQLPAVIMVTCYPCVPFAMAVLLYLRRILKNIANDKLFDTDTQIAFSRISVACLVISVITLIAGDFYLPFFIVGLAFAFFSLLVYVFKSVFSLTAARVKELTDKQESE